MAALVCAAGVILSKFHRFEVSTACHTVGGQAVDVQRVSAVCKQDQARWIELFGVHAPIGDITIDSTPNISGVRFDRQGRWTMVVPSQEALRHTASDGPNLLRDEWGHWTLAHEMGHVMLQAFLTPAPHALHTASGKPVSFIPEWFTEAVAIWMEPDTNRAVRITNAARSFQSDTAAVLSTLLTQINPAKAQLPDSVAYMDERDLAPCIARRPMCSSRPGMFEHIRRMTLYSGKTIAETSYVAHPSNAASLTDWFYGRSYALLLYVRTRGGVLAARTLLDRVERLQSDTAMLHSDSIWRQSHLELLERLPGLPQTVPEMDADWQRWIIQLNDSLPTRSRTRTED